MHLATASAFFFFFSSLLKVPVLVGARLRGEVVRYILRLYALPPIYGNRPFLTVILESTVLMDVLRDAQGTNCLKPFPNRLGDEFDFFLLHPV